jgi:serine/threonine protein kinase
MRGGQLLGEGGFGEVYTSVSDVGELETIHDFAKATLAKDPNSLNNCVFKLIPEYKERDEELQNNIKIHDIFKAEGKLNLTSLHPEISSVDTDMDTLLVYPRFEGDLQSALFQSDKAYEKVWTPKLSATPANPLQFTIDAAKSMLTFCDIIHRNNLLHKDIKLDNVFTNLTEGRVVVADYGMMTAKSDDTTSPTTDFYGNMDYMPPFCHFVANNKTPYDNYLRGNRSRFLTNTNGRSKYPSVGTDVFEEIVATYQQASPNTFQKEKMDLHPIGIIILQLLTRFQLQSAPLTDLAKDLMKNNTLTAKEALDRLPQFRSGGKRRTTIR